jgi:hypothetical protein
VALLGPSQDAERMSMADWERKFCGNGFSSLEERE